MKALIAISLFALSLFAGVGTSLASPGDDCHSKSVHGIWDCR